MEDQEIIALYWQRSEEAIKETEEKYGKYCYSIAYNILANHSDSEESVNDTYLHVWNSIPPYCPSILSVFLGKVVRWISIDKWRRQHTQKRGGGEVPLVLEELEENISDCKTVEQEIEGKMLAEAINAFVKTLPEQERKIFLCRYWYLDSIASIAKQFACSQSKVKSILYRTREKMRVYLKKGELL